MTEEIIENLPKPLDGHICTLKEASTDTTNGCNMSESMLKVVHFDKIPGEYSKAVGLKGKPMSNDALYVSADGQWYFIEFKNGSVDKSDVFRKIYDSIIMLVEMGIISGFQYARNHVRYILVYNSDKYGKIQKSPNRDSIYTYVHERAKAEERLFGIEKLEGYLLEEAHTYTERLFQEKFVTSMEEQENKAAV